MQRPSCIFDAILAETVLDEGDERLQRLGALRPAAVMCSVEPGPAASIIKPMIDVPPTA